MRQRKEVDSRVEQYERAVANREAVEALGWRERRKELPYARESEELLRDRLDENLAKLERMEAPGDTARREREIAEQLLAERSTQALTAAQIKTPRYIAEELGERPADPAKREAWDRGVKAIEGYRSEHGVTDKRRAFGREPAVDLPAGGTRGGAEEAARDAAPSRQGAPARSGEEAQQEHRARLRHR